MQKRAIPPLRSHTRLRTVAMLPLALAAATLAGCSGSGGAANTTPGTSGDFVVLRTTPPTNGRLFLNEPIRIDLSNQVDLESADLNTVSFQVFDLNGNPLSERPAGVFGVADSAGDPVPGRQLVFTPLFPTNNTYDNGGFKPGRRYLVQLVSGDPRRNTVLRDVAGRGLAQPVSFEFTTADGTTPSQLFSDTRPGGPRVQRAEITPSTPDGVALNQFGLEPVEVRLFFDQPLNPNDANVPVRVSADPLRRLPTDRGRISLEYTDRTGRVRWIPATVDLEVNTRAGSQVVLRPIGILPNNASVRVIVANTVEDMSGESNVTDASYQEVAATFTTQSRFEPQYDAIVERFEMESSQLDLEAAFLEPRATLGNGRVRASFAFDGGESRLVYEPNQREVILNTDFTQITPVGSPPINVAGGVFNFRSVKIPAGVEVRALGTNPMVWLVTGDFEVNGRLSVDGGAGARVNSLNSPNVPTPGGIGVAGGGSGGAGSPNARDRSPFGQPGFGPGQRPEGGGDPGQGSCTTACNQGAAGGGGSFSTQGDPNYPPNNAAARNDWPQVTGEGGQGCLNKSQPGGAPGPRPFTDTRNDNDFWGNGVNVARSIRIQGELAAPIGGAGGGGGGDRSTSCRLPDPSGFLNDNKGGGGGGGAGVLIVQALGKIKIGEDGLISANGGEGGGGEQAGANNQGGGGGAGSGGMIVLMAGQGFEIFVHGRNETTALYGRNSNGVAESDFKFAISADGGIGTQGRFGGREILNKYPPGDRNWNQKPTGGFGGMGIVQLLSPPGDDADGTGNRLDDFISFFVPDQNVQGGRREVSPTRKRELLAWRGWPAANGQLVDDNGNALNVGDNEGDIRPSPIMLPSPFGALSRARSRWIDLGFAVRQRVDNAPGPNVPGVVVAPAGSEPDPDFGDPTLGFAGTSRDPAMAGYALFDPSLGTLAVPPIEIDGQSSFAIQAVDPASSFDGQPAYRVELVIPATLGAVANRYAHYRLEALGASGAGLVDFRILGHQDRFVFLEPEGTFPAEATRVRVLAKFFQPIVDNQPGLGPTYTYDAQGSIAPVANVRIAFAFHSDPRIDPATGNAFGERWPADASFETDLRSQGFLDYLERASPSYVQWDVLFNSRFHPTEPNNINAAEPLSPDMPLPELDFLVLPYRF